MTTLIGMALTNAILATALAFGVGLISLLKVRPALLHLLYVVVLVRLVMPPMLQVPLPVMQHVLRAACTLPAARATPPSPAEARISRGDVSADMSEPELVVAAGPDDDRQRATESRADLSESRLPDEETRSLPFLEPQEETETETATASAPRPTAPAAAMPRTARALLLPSLSDVLKSLVLIWIVGSCLWLVVAATRIASMHRVLRRATSVPGELQTLVVSLASILGLKRVPRAVVVDAPISPAVWPIGPFLILPRALVDRMDTEALRLVMAHELAHLRRRDHWVRLLELGVTSIYWWLPTLWWVRRQLRSVEEQCCDAWVVQAWPHAATRYARSLVAAIELVKGPPRHNVIHPATGIGEARTMRVRLRKIVQSQTPAQPTRLGLLVFGILATFCCVVTPGTKAEFDRPPVADQRADRNTATESFQPRWKFDRLPPSCDVLYKVLSPNEKKVAFVGSDITDEGFKQYGLFVVELESGATRRLLDTAIKTAPAWSPDSQRLAIGNAAGYVTRYAFVLVDVETGQIDQTGALGVGPAWSPDGTEIAVSTEIRRGGSWNRGIPIDGRLGIWSVDERKMRLITPPAFNVYDDRTGRSTIGGMVRPAWSPDGQWIAFELIVRSKLGDEEQSRHELWAVNREGTEMRVLIGKSQPYRWSDDGASVLFEDGEAAVDLADAPIVPRSEWPQPDVDFRRTANAIQAGLERASAFDTAPIFARNRQWQNPAIDHLKTVEFTHSMSPIRLDERFSWRRDGTCSMEVIHREDEHADEQLGRIWLLTSSGEQLTLGARSHYPQQKTLLPNQVRKETLGHLMGTRMNCVAQDWARYPSWFDLTDVRPAEIDGQTVLDLKRRRDRRRERYLLNVGAMFHTTSWAYIHDLVVLRTELVIDDKTGRILKEIDYLRENAPAEFDFTDWLDTDDGQSVPRTIRVSIPDHGFRSEYQFQWLPEQLWLLESGKSWFEGMRPQVEQIVDLTVDGDTPDVGRHFTNLREALEELNATPAETGEQSRIPTIPFELGKTVSLNWTQPDSPAARIEELRFTVGETGKRFREMWVHPSVRVELKLGETEKQSSAESAQLVLYDADGRPVHTFAIPLGAVNLLQRSAEPFAARIGRCSSLWLNPDRASLPNVQYAFHESGDKQVDYAIRDESNPHFIRGVTMTLALDALTQNPESYRLPVSFEANLDGRRVIVGIVTGPKFGWVFGNGIHHSWRGYTVSTNTAAVVVVDSETGRPILERYGDTEVHFLDYVEPQPGQFTPRRIAVLQNGDRKYDFRFQVLDDQVWLFDRSYSDEASPVVFVDGIQVEGRPPQESSRSSAAADDLFDDFDWGELTERRLLADADHPLARQMAFTQRPFANPNYKLLTRMTITDPQSVSFDLGRSPLWHSVNSWTLTHTGAHGVTLARSTPTQRMNVSGAVPINWGEVTPIHVPVRLGGYQRGDASETSWLRTVRLDRNDAGHVTGTLELVSQRRYKEDWSVIAAVLLEESGLPVASAETEHTFRVVHDVYSEYITLDFGELPASITATHVCIGFAAVQIGAPMGSRWGRFHNSWPIFPLEQLLSNESPEVALVGLQELFRSIDDHIERNEHPQDTRQAHQVMQGIVPFAQYLERQFAESNDANTLSLACRLAGHSQQRKYVPTLVALLKHEDPHVQDAAAVGLGLLGDARALDRVLAVYQRTKDPNGRSPLAWQLFQESQMALDNLGQGPASE